MDIFENSNFDNGGSFLLKDDPSLLVVILDLNLEGWIEIKDEITLNTIVKSLLIMMNAHMSLNNSNKVAFIITSFIGSRFLYPKHENHTKDGDNDEKNQKKNTNFIHLNMHRPFKIVNEIVIEEYNKFLKESSDLIGKYSSESKISGALGMSLCYSNKILTQYQNMGNFSEYKYSPLMNEGGAEKIFQDADNKFSEYLTAMKSKILIITPDDTDNINYVRMMNCIFAAQKMKTTIDVAKLGKKNSSHLQQASNETNGIYLHIENPKTLLLLLTTVYSIMPSIRSHIVTPITSNINYSSKCFITNKTIDIGYVCLVCLCILSIVPESNFCPICKSVFDKSSIEN